MNNKSQVGLGLIEVLVSMLVIAVGMLGVLGMQTKAMQRGQETLVFSQTSSMAKQLFDRLRTNQHYVVNDLAVTLHEDLEDSTASKQCEYEYQSGEDILVLCDAEEMYAWDLMDWATTPPPEVANAGWKATMNVISADIGNVDSVILTLNIQVKRMKSLKTESGVEVVDNNSITLGADNDYEQFSYSTRL
jgi:type IV pilus modification protein PilV